MSDLPLPGRCGSPKWGTKSGKRKMAYCEKYPAKDSKNGRCELHGATSGRPIESGKFSTKLNEDNQFRQDWERHLADPDLLNTSRIVARHEALYDRLDKKIAAMGDDIDLDLLHAARQLGESTATVHERIERIKNSRAWGQERARQFIEGIAALSNLMETTHDKELIDRFTLEYLGENAPDNTAVKALPAAVPEGEIVE